MRAVYLVRYRMGKQLCMLPVYAANLSDALRSFDRRMGSFGAEREQYSVISHRQIPEREIRHRLHESILAKLSAEDRHAFYKDRSARQQIEMGNPDKDTLEYLESIA